MTRTVGELREARLGAGISQTALAAEVGCSASNIWRLEALQHRDVAIGRLCEIASILGYEIALSVHPIGDPIRDKGQQATARRFRATLHESWHVVAELLLPNPGDRRSWDLFLRLSRAERGGRVGVDIETRVHDVQALVRRTRERERDGGAERILIVLADTAANRRTAPELRLALGDMYGTPARRLMRELRQGRPLSGSGVILV